MDIFKLSSNKPYSILALGAESSGNFSIFDKGSVYFSNDFGDLLNEANFILYKQELLKFLKKNKIIPQIILCDLHPLFTTSDLALKLSKKYKAELIPVQHHIAHIFSAIGDRILHNTNYKLQTTNCIGISCDGTGLGFDEKIWGGEIFKIYNLQFPIYNKNSTATIERVGHLENQVLLGGEMAIKEPARMIIGIINKFTILNFKFSKKSRFSNIKTKKELAYNLIKNYYSKNEFELLWNQMQQNFNCIQTSSTARILDAVSVLLGFSKNERLSKHGPVFLLEKNSSKPYAIKPKLEISKHNYNSNSLDGEQSSSEMLVLNTTYLFEYLVKNLRKDKKRLAATAQYYIAEGLFEIINSMQYKGYPIKMSGRASNVQDTYFAGGIANNKIVSSLLGSRSVYMSKKIPRGDAGLSFGQIFYYLLANPRD